MKKSLVALAALAATAAFAQSSVTITGIMDANYSAISNLNDQTTNLVGQNGARTSTLKFIGSEDLGGGNAAVFQLEVQPQFISGDGNKFNSVFPANSSTTVAANSTKQNTGQASQQSGLTGKGESFVGINSAEYGNVKLGTINSNTFQAFAAVSALGTGIGSGYGAGNTIGDFTRFESAVRYDTPTFNGFSAGVLKGTKNDSQYGVIGSTSTGVTLRRPGVLDWGINYANGPLAVKYTTLASTATPNEASSQGVTTTTKMLGAVYDAGVAKIAGATGTVKSDAATSAADYKINIASVTVPFMGTYRGILQTGSVKYSGGSSASVNVGEKVKTTGWALEKDLSKRTFVYLRGESTDLAGNLAGAYVANGTTLTSWNNGSKRSVTAVGVSHQF